MQDVPTDARLMLDGPLTVRHAAAICATLRQAIGQHPLVTIDCAAAEDVDLSFIQLLIAARDAAARSGNQVTLAAHPAGALLDALTRGGFRVTNPDPADPQSFWFDGASQ